jgi:hypothetical protein
MTVQVPLEIKEFHVQVSGRPERAVETPAPNRADQAFDEWMRQRRERVCDRNRSFVVPAPCRDGKPRRLARRAKRPLGREQDGSNPRARRATTAWPPLFSNAC